LTKLRDPRAIEPLAGRLTDVFEADAASKALISFGSAAEKAVLKHLDNTEFSNINVRRAACGVLKAIGTRESEPALIIQAQDIHMRSAANEALTAIRSRK